MTTSAMSTNDIKWNVKKDIIKVTYGSKYQEEYYAVHYISYLLTLDQSKNENGLQKTYVSIPTIKKVEISKSLTVMFRSF